MNKIKVLPLRKFFPQDINYLCSKFLNSVELIELESYDEEKIYEYLLKHKVDVLLGEPQSEKILSVSNNVKLIQLPWTGVDRLNFSLFKKFPHINICNSHSNALAVAEYAVSLMMSLMKQLPYHDKNLREGDWCRPSPQKPEKFKPPVYISGSHIGIIGFGEIGQLIQKFLQPYSCEFHILIRNLSKYSKRNADDISFYDHSKLKEFIKNVDVLFVSTPLTLETKEMINQDFLKLMKESSYIINISRGEIISEKALYESLKTKRDRKSVV